MKKATFTQRFIAYLLDGFIVLIISSIVASGLSTKKIENLEKDLENLVTSYTQGEITPEEYLKETQELTYEIEKNSTAINIVYVVMNIGYFVIFQFLNKGQTLGKKIMKIKIVDNDEKEPNIIQMIIRTCIINQILPNILVLILVLTISKNAFMNIYSLISMVLYTFVIASSLMILYRNDKLGLHDIMSKTKVVKEGR